MNISDQNYPSKSDQHLGESNNEPLEPITHDLNNEELNPGIQERENIVRENLLQNLRNIGINIDQNNPHFRRLLLQILRLGYIQAEDPTALEYKDRILIIGKNPINSEMIVVKDFVENVQVRPYRDASKYPTGSYERGIEIVQINTLSGKPIKFTFNFDEDVPDPMADDIEVQESMVQRNGRIHLIIYRITPDAQQAIEHFYARTGFLGLFGEQQGYKDGYLEGEFPKEDRMTRLDMYKAKRSKQLEP